jgi:hypothetical protein
MAVDQIAQSEKKGEGIVRVKAILPAALLASLLGVFATAAHAAAEATNSAMSCTPQRPAAFPRDTVQVQVWVPKSTTQYRYLWSATGGRITGQDSVASWDFTGVGPGSYTATVKVSGDELPVECSLRVVVLDRDDGRGVFTRVTGRQVLMPGAVEVPGYGLYSYILFGNPPDDASRDRYLKAIQAYLNLIPDLTALEKYAKPSDLNATYVPVDTEPPTSVSAEWVMRHYDYARAAVLLRVIPTSHADGPYIVSSARPLTGGDGLAKDFLLQDLSSVPAGLVSDWVKLFINQASQPNFWQPKSAAMVALRLRTAVGILAIGLPEVQRSLTSWISWTHSIGGT